MQKQLKELAHCKCSKDIKLPNFWLNQFKEKEMSRYCDGSCEPPKEELAPKPKKKKANGKNGGSKRMKKIEE